MKMEARLSNKQEVVMRATMKRKETKTQLTDTQPSQTSAALLRELVAHLRQNRTQLREEWARRITDAQLLTAMSNEEIFSEATSVYDNYVEVLETGSVVLEGPAAELKMNEQVRKTYLGEG